MKSRLCQRTGALGRAGILSAAIIAVAALWSQSPSPEPAPMPAPDAAPLAVDRGAAGVWQSLLKLHTRASLLMITAHPDDEDGGMLAYESRGQGARVSLLTLSRGESGANVMSPDFFDALGLVRTEELLAAGRYYGVDQYFGRVVNFGFSKTKEETLEQWQHDRVLYDAVRVVRLTRPLVVTSVFIGGPSDGHGNHQVAGQMAQEVFKAAGDPNVFPDQIQAGLLPWKPLKVYARTPRARVTAQGVYDYATHHFAPAQVFDYIADKWLPWGLPSNVEVPEGQYDPLLGRSFVQLSREGLGHQKSQNGGTGVPPAGPVNAAYYRFASAVPASDKEKSFFEGIDTSLVGIAELAKGGDSGFLKQGLAAINAQVEEAMKNFSALQPDKVAPYLAAGLKTLNNLVADVASSGLPTASKYDIGHELRIKQEQFQEAIARALGISVLATVAPERENGRSAEFLGAAETFQVAIPGQQFSVNVHLANQSAAPVQVNQISLVPGARENWTVSLQGQPPRTLAGGQAANIRFRVTAPQNAEYTRPYFQRRDVEQPYYEILKPEYANLPLPPYPLAAQIELLYEGVPVRMAQVVQSVKRITGLGVVMNPLVVGPAISVSAAPRTGILPLDAKSFLLTANIHSNVKGPAKGTVKLELPQGWQSSPATAEFSTSKDGEEQMLSFRVTPARLQEKPYTVTVVAEYNGRQYKEGYRAVGYEGLRPYHLYRPASYTATGVDVKVASGLTVGYVMGSGDEIPECLENLGIKVHMLASADLATGDLGKYDVILLGVRTYAVREDLKTSNSRLLDYVKNGGVVIVQYNTPEFDHNFGPYPYTMTGDPEEVTDERSKVEILEPGNPVFNWPNKITAKDFEGWVAERGSKFMSQWDPRYQPLLETHDPGQDSQKGGMLYARYGKGVYIYNAYAFYRQLPEGVPGAYRLFANLVSLPRNPQLRSAASRPGSQRPAHSGV